MASSTIDLASRLTSAGRFFLRLLDRLGIPGVWQPTRIGSIGAEFQTHPVPNGEPVNGALLRLSAGRRGRAYFSFSSIAPFQSSLGGLLRKALAASM